jgi:hypothetical protein
MHAVLSIRDAIRDLEVPVIDVTPKTQPTDCHRRSHYGMAARTLAAGLQCRFVISDSI